MDNTLLILTILSIILSLIVLFLLLKRKKETQKPEDKPAEPDSSLKIEIVSHPFKFKVDADNPLNGQIVEAVNRMGGTGSNAEEKYQNSINNLKADAAKVIDIMSKEYRDMPENQYLDRWSIVQLLIDLRHPASIQFFDDLLQSKIPPERFDDPSFTSSVGEEVMIRTTAVEGLVRLGKENNSDAIQLLLKHIRHENFSVKRAAVQGYVECGGNKAKDQLLNMLNDKDRFILDIKRQDVRNIPQPKAERNGSKRSDRNDRPGMPGPFS